MASKNIIIAGSLGTLVEWAEFCFYGYMISQFSHLFFPMLTANLAIIAGFGTFAVSYIARPLGGLLFGYIGDSGGRKKAFSGSILLMSIATLGIGLLPSYQLVGNLAPILLIFMRFLQGLAVAGEYPGSSIFIIEHHSHRPYFASSWIATASAAGMLIGGLAAVIVSLPAMPTWAWRVPFCLSFFTCFVGFYIRRQLTETQEYRQLLEKNQIDLSPIKTVLKDFRLPLLQTAAIGAFVGIFVYVCNIWWISFAIEKHYFSPFQARSLATITMFAVVLCTPLMGWLADCRQGRTLMKFGIIGDIITVPILFYVTTFGSFTAMLGISLLYAICHAAFTAPMFKYLADIFPTKVRYSGQSIAWNTAVAIFGSSAPLIAQMLSNQGFLRILVLYVMLAGIIALWISSKNVQALVKKSVMTETGA